MQVFFLWDRWCGEVGLVWRGTGRCELEWAGASWNGLVWICAGEMPIFCLIVALHNAKLRCESRVWIFGVLPENPDFAHKVPKIAKKNLCM